MSPAGGIRDLPRPQAAEPEREQPETPPLPDGDASELRGPRSQGF